MDARPPGPGGEDRAGRASASDLLLTSIGYFPKAENHYFARPRGSIQMIVIYCVRGHGWATLGAKKYSVGPGDVLVIPPDQPHAYGADASGLEPWTIYWLHVTGRNVAAMQRLLTQDGALPVFHCGEDPETVGLLRQTSESLKQSYGADHLLLASFTIGCAWPGWRPCTVAGPAAQAPLNESNAVRHSCDSTWMHNYPSLNWRKWPTSRSRTSGPHSSARWDIRSSISTFD